MIITSYLVFNGEAEEAAKFYADLLGGKIESLYRYCEAPTDIGMSEVADEDKSKVMYCCVDYPNGLMRLADRLSLEPLSFGNGGHVFTISCDSIAQTEEVYGKLARDARQIVCKMGESFYAKCYGELVDRFGVRWTVMYEG